MQQFDKQKFSSSNEHPLFFLDTGRQPSTLNQAATKTTDLHSLPPVYKAVSTHYQESAFDELQENSVPNLCFEGEGWNAGISSPSPPPYEETSLKTDVESDRDTSVPSILYEEEVEDWVSQTRKHISFNLTGTSKQNKKVNFASKAYNKSSNECERSNDDVITPFCQLPKKISDGSEVDCSSEKTKESLHRSTIGNHLEAEVEGEAKEQMSSGATRLKSNENYLSACNNTTQLPNEKAESKNHRTQCRDGRIEKEVEVIVIDDDEETVIEDGVEKRQLKAGEASTTSVTNGEANKSSITQKLRPAEVKRLRRKRRRQRRRERRLEKEEQKRQRTLLLSDGEDRESLIDEPKGDVILQETVADKKINCVQNLVQKKVLVANISQEELCTSDEEIPQSLVGSGCKISTNKAELDESEMLHKDAKDDNMSISSDDLSIEVMTDNSKGKGELLDGTKYSSPRTHKNILKKMKIKLYIKSCQISRHYIKF